MSEEESKKLKNILFNLIEERREKGSSNAHDPMGDEVVLKAAELLIRIG